MDIVKSMTVFLEVANLGGFAPAARSLGISTSSVSRQVIELEEWLNVNLFQRTTRSLSLTEEGSQYLEECQKVVTDVERIQNISSQTQIRPSGILRITAPVFFAKECLHNLIPEFLNIFPEIKIELNAVDRRVNLVDEGFDLAFRVGELPDSTLVARRLSELRLGIFASPEYIKLRGKPQNATELKEHNCIVDTVAGFNNRWPIKSGKTRKNIAVNGNASVNNGELARNLAINGVGIALLPHFFVLDQLREGTLLELLENQVDSYGAIYAVFPKSRHMPPKVRAFVDHAVTYFDQRNPNTTYFK